MATHEPIEDEQHAARILRPTPSRVRAPCDIECKLREMGQNGHRQDSGDSLILEELVCAESEAGINQLA